VTRRRLESVPAGTDAATLWDGPTERGRELVRAARRRLDAAESWQPPARGATLGGAESSPRDTSGHEVTDQDSR
jgi:hypothetical protein